MHRIRSITFDAGGTLLYPYPSVGEIYAEYMAKHGLVLSAAELERAFGRTIKAAHTAGREQINDHDDKRWWRQIVADTISGLGEVDNFDALFEELWVAFAEPRYWRLYDGAEETLIQLRERGYCLAILSNWDKRLRSLLDGFALSDYFEHIVISAEVGVEKPAAQIFHHTQERLKASPESILHIGDSPRHDQAGAQAAGWQWLLIDHSHPTGTHETLASLPQLIARLDAAQR
jgi:putative hydrolase of the HAD superfamily